MLRGMRSRLVGLGAAAFLAAYLATATAAPPPGLDCENSGYVDETGHCTPLHPGDSVSFPGYFCTLNFLWVDPKGNRYFGTAGHCTFGSPLGTIAADGLGRPIGKLVYSVWNSVNSAQDLALIRLYPSISANGSLRHWGGPIGQFDGYTSQPVTLCFFGQADGVAIAHAHRNLIATSITQPKTVQATGPISFGDSGAPVISASGRAVGWVEAIAGSYAPIYQADGGTEVGEEVVTRIGPAVAAAEKALHVRLRLVTVNQQQCSLRPN